MVDILDDVLGIVGAENVSVGDAIVDDHTHDECLTVAGIVPLAVVCPQNTEEVAEILRACNEQHVSVTARGSATGLSGACTPTADGIVLSFEQMAAILEIDTANHVA